MARFILNETSYFGAGCRKEIAGELQRRGFKKAFMVTDVELVKFGVFGMVEEVLKGIGFPYAVFTDLQANPTVKNVQDGVRAFQESGADCIIAVGGGSVIDTGKAIGIIGNNPEFADVVSLEGTAETKRPSVPVIAAPTTAGTAAEVTINYVITDEKTRRKMVCVDPHDIPAVAVVDAELMYSLPKGLTAATGMDALTHAIEGYITLGAWEMSDMTALYAIRLIHKNLANAVKNGKDKPARENMALAQYIAGMGFSNVGLGIAHSMAHPLGAVFNVPHGVANAVLLPTVMEFNAQSDKKAKYRDIAEAMGVSTAGMDDDAAAFAAVGAVRALAEEVGIPKTITALGIKEKDIPGLARDAYKDVCTGGNPRPVTAAEIEALYKKLL
jgi:lactaldehyde reductase